MKRLERFKQIAREWGDTARLIAGILAIVLGVKGLIFPLFATIKPESILTIDRYENIRMHQEPGERPILTFTAVFIKHRDCFTESTGMPVRFIQNGVPLGGALMGLVPSPKSPDNQFQRANLHLVLPIDYDMEEPSVAYMTSIYRCGNSVPIFYNAKPLEIPPLGPGKVR